MKRKSILKHFILILLIAALAISFFGCADGTPSGSSSEPPQKTTFTFEVYLKDGSLKSSHEITTEKSTVGEALVDRGLIEGENGPFGLYVKKVDGVVADYDVDGTYWAFYVNGQYAVSGVDTTKPEDNAVYSFRIE